MDRRQTFLSRPKKLLIEFALIHEQLPCLKLARIINLVGLVASGVFFSGNDRGESGEKPSRYQTSEQRSLARNERSPRIRRWRWKVRVVSPLA